MASLHLKSFEVHVFFSGWRSRPEPDISSFVQSFTERTAVLRVMQWCCETEAEVASVALEGGERWLLFDVRIVDGQLVYGQAVPG